MQSCIACNSNSGQMPHPQGLPSDSCRLITSTTPECPSSVIGTKLKNRTLLSECKLCTPDREKPEERHEASQEECTGALGGIRLCSWQNCRICSE